MNRPSTKVVAAVVAAVVVVGCAVVAARSLFGCGTRDEANLIEQFRADPLFATVPSDGTLVEDSAQPGTCQEKVNATAEYLGGVTSVRRVYETPTVYPFDQLRRLYDPAARAGGWSFEQDAAQSFAEDPRTGRGNQVTYCRQTGDQVFYARAVSWEPTPTDIAKSRSTGVEGRVRVVLNTGGPASECDRNDHPDQTLPPR